MESFRSFVSFSGGELSKDTEAKPRRNYGVGNGGEFEVSQAASDRTQDDGAGNLFEVGPSLLLTA